MKGLMQDWPLRIPKILDHAACHHGEREVVTRTVEGPIHRTTYREIHRRARQAAQALLRLGVKPGDRVGTMGWNTYRHMEAWYAIAGAGGVCHTINPRLFPDQIQYIVNHAEDAYIVLDLSFVPIFEALKDKIPAVRGYVILTDRVHMPATVLPNVFCYEDLLAAESGDFDWVSGDENEAAGLCYTSGTTGNPKGVLYSHRSNVLHALACNCADGMGFRSADSIMPIAPMFHANAWAVIFGAPMQGAKLVLPGPKLDGVSLHELLTGEQVTCTAAVPTVWLGLLKHLEDNELKLPHLKRVVIGGAAVPPAMIETFERKYGVPVVHVWGMTEMSPIGTLCVLKAGMEDAPYDRQLARKAKQGRAPFTVEMRIVDGGGVPLPHDGRAFGHLQVRGPGVIAHYFKGEGDEVLTPDGWFDTGDVATIDAEGFMQITDRAKDVIKSGGEWISSIEIENIAVGCPGVAEAAVIGVRHPKWDERPLLIVQCHKGATVTREAVLTYLDGRIARWWTPDDVVFVPEIPHTATGKIQKLALRDMFKDYVLPTAKG